MHAKTNSVEQAQVRKLGFLVMQLEQYNKEMAMATDFLRVQVKGHDFTCEKSFSRKGMMWITWSNRLPPIEHRIRLSYPTYDMVGIRWEAVVDFVVVIQGEDGHSEMIVDFVSLGELGGKKYNLRNSLLMLSRRRILKKCSPIHFSNLFLNNGKYYTYTG